MGIKIRIEDNIFYSCGDGYFMTANKVYLHRYIYEKENGKIPKGFIIHHIDEDRQNNNIDNLECITRKRHNIIHMTGRKHSNETKKKISTKNKGKKNGMYGRCGIRNPMYGKHLSGDTRHKLRIANIGKKLSEETKMKLSKLRKGSKSPCSKKVKCIETGKIWNCVVDAVNDTGIKKISYAARGVRKSAGGYTWQYI